jgi:predicted pyridoxine 5'-phosphate oxidase superfamily flavin-nucleotide-binding protein
MLDHLNTAMRELLGEQEMVFLATADSKGECDCSFRAGEKGFIHALDERTLAYPEYRGNGVYASLGNLVENPHVALLFLDFFHRGIGLHVNGRARVCSPEELTRTYLVLPDGGGTRRRAEFWVLVEVVEAYVHCSKHIPLLVKRPKEIDWGTDDVQKKGGDFFHTKECPRPWGDAETNDRS